MKGKARVARQLNIKMPTSFAPVYAIKALAALVVIIIAALVLPVLPMPLIGICWALLSCLATLSIAYPWVIRKTKNQVEFTAEGRISRLNNGRIFCIAASFVLGGVLMAGLMVGAPTWKAPEWVIVVASIPVYLGLYTIVERVIKREVAAEFRKSRCIWVAAPATAVLMCIAYAIVCAVMPAETYSNAYEAYQAATNPFANSGSILLVEGGKISALLNSMIAYGLSQLAAQSLPVFVVGKAIAAGSAFFGVSNILGLCSLNRADALSVFSAVRPLGSTERTPIMRRAVITITVLPVVLCAAFIIANVQVDARVSAGEKTLADSLIERCASVSVYLVDGVPYDKYKLDDILASAEEQSEALAASAKEELVPLINAACDARLANVDSYLEWYYSLPADYEILLSQIGVLGEDYMVSKLEEGVDDTELQDALESYTEQAAALNDELKQEIESAQLLEVPEGYQTVVETLSMESLTSSFEPTERIVAADERLATSAAAGIGAGLLTKHLVTKLMNKIFFKKLSAKLTAQLSTKAASAAVGSAVGSVAPGVGTVIGFAAGLAVGVGVDYAMVEIDRALNYDTYKQEVIDSIEASRSDLLAVVE